MYGRGSGRIAPIKVGDTLDVKIEGVGAKGDGIARIEGFVLFVPGVNSGDEVTVRVTKVLRSVGFAEVVGSGSASKKPKAKKQAEEDEAPPSEEDEPDYESEESDDYGEDSDSFGEDSEDF